MYVLPLATTTLIYFCDSFCDSIFFCFHLCLCCVLLCWGLPFLALCREYFYFLLTNNLQFGGGY